MVHRHFFLRFLMTLILASTCLPAEENRLPVRLPAAAVQGTGIRLPNGITAGDWGHIQAEIRQERADPSIPQTFFKKGENYSDQCGYSVAVSGDTAVVGARYESGPGGSFGYGTVYVFKRTGGVWNQQAYLNASNRDMWDALGSAVAISGDTIVVGAPGEGSSSTGVNGPQANNSATNSGAAYVFLRSSGLWSQQAYLKASNTDAGDQFGSSVAVAGDTIIVGAPGEGSSSTGVNGPQANNFASNSGAAYVFSRSSGIWSQQAYGIPVRFTIGGSAIPSSILVNQTFYACFQSIHTASSRLLSLEVTQSDGTRVMYSIADKPAGTYGACLPNPYGFATCGPHWIQIRGYWQWSVTGTLTEVTYQGWDSGDRRDIQVICDSSEPAPVITGTSPSSLPAGGETFEITVNGSHFARRSTVQWNGSARATTFVSSSQLTATIHAGDIASPGSATLSVYTSPPGGGTASLTVPISNTTLRLINNRFEVSVHWTSYQDGSSGAGRGVPVTTQSGYFWFFDPSNIELMITILDGRAINGCFWVKYGALSDVQYFLLVRDTFTGISKTYSNPAHNLASRIDTYAFNETATSGFLIQPMWIW